MEIRGVDTTRNNLFPFSALRLLGELQIFLGVSCVVLGAVDVTMMTLNYDAEDSRYALTPEEKARFEMLVTLTVTSAPVWCGMWFLVTGSLGTCVSQNKSQSLKFLKSAFLVLSVLYSALFAPACIVLSTIIAVTRHTMDPGNLLWLATTLSAFFSFCEMGIAITSASICCCCSPLQMAKVHILFADSSDQRGPPLPQAKTMPDPPFPREQHLAFPRKPAARKPRLKEAKVQTDAASLPDEPVPLPAMTTLPPKAGSLPPARLHRLVDPHQHHPAQRRPVVVVDSDEERFDEGYPRQYVGSASYDRLRKWALPSDRLY